MAFFGFYDKVPEPDGSARIRGAITIGAAGAVSTVVAEGVDTVTHDSTGLYTILLSDRFYEMKAFTLTILRAGGTGGLTACLTDNSTNTGTPSVSFGIMNYTGVLTDPTSGDVLYFELVARNLSGSEY